MPLTPEQQAREKIDEQLEASGWVVQDFNSMNIHADSGVAVREFPLKWKEGAEIKSGFADYLLYIDGWAIGVIEAKPADERDLNSKLEALIGSQIELTSERPTLLFAGAGVVPDHAVPNSDLLIEVKFIRGHTSPSKASEGIAADLTKYSPSSYILFIVYDPHRRIADDAQFARDFESRGRCSVRIVR